MNFYSDLVYLNGKFTDKGFNLQFLSVMAIEWIDPALHDFFINLFYIEVERRMISGDGDGVRKKMRSFTVIIILAVLVMPLVLTGAALADGHSGRHGHHGFDFDVVIGGPVWDPWWYPWPYYYPYYYYPYYYPPVVAEPSTPPTYIEPEENTQPSSPSGVWYYCPGSKTYYPYVRECPGGWQTVPARPPSE